MPTPGLSLERAQEVVALVEQKLREGYRPAGMTGAGPGAIAAAGQALIEMGEAGSPATIETRLRTAKAKYGLEPDWTLYRPQRYQQPVPRAVVQPAITPIAETPRGPGVRILAVGDLHNDPRQPHRIQALAWIARFASEQGFERIIQVGDWSTYDSVNLHDKNDSLAARLKPGIKDDLDNLKASHQAFRSGMDKDYKPRLTFLQGNHENRLERFENLNPEVAGTFTLARDELFAQFGWRSRPYGELFYCEGVAFTHHPTNGAGRAFGGKTGPQRAANETTVPVVSGHTHRAQVYSAPKIGPLDTLMMVEIGCGLHWGEVEAYAQHSMTGWWYGVVPMTLNSGVITDLSFVSMLTLRARYSDDGGDARTT